MSLHGLPSVTIGVPNVAETAAYYTDFGLAPDEENWFSTRDAGRQLHIEYAPTRRLLELRVAADDADDLARAAASVARLGVPAHQDRAGLEMAEPVTGMRVRLEVAPRLKQDPVPASIHNGPGRLERQGRRAAGPIRSAAPVPESRRGAVARDPTRSAAASGNSARGASVIVMRPDHVVAWCGEAVPLSADTLLDQITGRVAASCAGADTTARQK